MTPVHELVHTLGFVHEHTRPDRDNFISVNMDNIEHGKEKNFEKRTEGTSELFEKGSVDSRNTPYDVLSLLHYGPQVRSILLKVLDKKSRVVFTRTSPRMGKTSLPTSMASLTRLGLNLNPKTPSL